MVVTSQMDRSCCHSAVSSQRSRDDSSSSRHSFCRVRDRHSLRLVSGCGFIAMFVFVLLNFVDIVSSNA